ncbi:Acryloyl-coenzyme A reductase [Candidatus Lokiarchaeum ossiferum]|uniref:Acryloyl-coenzyme A reductase n=1 Tax=Candidatus Lokiarchaeum ossiferum TaxID=2951803 RepID=A0ABY6HL51_9ARCH|nr:Acryloyl-coenzyme A reductase [Candidatus Lokiarchaeum sp. B-35]
MKAAIINEHGSLNNIQVDEVPTPKISSSEVLIETKYGGLNHLDLFVIPGWPGLRLPMPHILGSDGSGIIKEVGDDVTRFQAGDRVLVNPGVGCGLCDLCLSGKQNLCRKFSILGENTSGTFAEYFKIPSQNVLKIPDDYPLDLAAAAPLNFLTAWRMLVTQGNIQQGEYVLIQGASGGVATAAIQIAKYFQTKVIVTTSTQAKIEKAKELGADIVINYHETPNYSKYIFKDITRKHGVDLVIDSVGQATFNTSLKLLKTGGRLVTCGSTTGPKVDLDLRPIFWKQLQIYGSTMSNHHEFSSVMKLVLNGTFTPIIDTIFPIDEIQAAEKYLSEGKHFGKVLVQF